MLALAPIRKNKGQTFSLLILLVVAGALLYLGLMLTLNTGKFFDKKAEEQGAADIVVKLQDTIFSEADVAYFRDNPKVQSVETVETIIFPVAKIEYAEGKISQNLVFINEKMLGGMLSPHFVGERLPADADSVYVPYILHAGGGFDLGDAITIEYGGRNYKLKISGFFEDVYFGYISGGSLGMILPDYDEFVSRLESPIHCSTLFIRVYDKRDAEMYRDYSFDKALSTDPALLSSSFKSGTYYQENKQYSTTTMNIMSVIIVLFSILIVVVALIVVRFRITNSIEDDMANTGSLKAAGFTSGQIILRN